MSNSTWQTREGVYNWLASGKRWRSSLPLKSFFWKWNSWSHEMGMVFATECHMTGWGWTSINLRFPFGHHGPELAGAEKGCCGSGGGWSEGTGARGRASLGASGWRESLVQLMVIACYSIPPSKVIEKICIITIVWLEFAVSISLGVALHSAVLGSMICV